MIVKRRKDYFFEGERRKLKAAIRQLQAEKEALQGVPSRKDDEEDQRIQQFLLQIDGLQKQRDFMDQEMTLLCMLNNSKDECIRELQDRLKLIPECIQQFPEKAENSCSENLDLLNLTQGESGEDKVCLQSSV